MLGQEREGNVFEPFCLSGSEDEEVLPGFWLGRGGDQVRPPLWTEVRLWERPRLTLLWYAGARPGVRIDMSRCRRLCSAHQLNGAGIVAGGIPPLDADSLSSQRA